MIGSVVGKGERSVEKGKMESGRWEVGGGKSTAKGSMEKDEDESMWLGGNWQYRLGGG